MICLNILEPKKDGSHGFSYKYVQTTSFGSQKSSHTLPKPYAASESGIEHPCISTTMGRKNFKWQKSTFRLKIQAYNFTWSFVRMKKRNYVLTTLLSQLFVYTASGAKRVFAICENARYCVLLRFQKNWCHFNRPTLLQSWLIGIHSTCLNKFTMGKIVKKIFNFFSNLDFSKNSFSQSCLEWKHSG